nr:10937_t:CDS:2 [Entrophospora candida]
MATSTISSNDRVAFIGLGAMGYPMATNLQKYLAVNQFPNLLVYNRTYSKAQSLAESVGAIATQSLQDVAEQANIIFTCLLNDQAVSSIYKELLKYSDPRKFNNINNRSVIFIDCSTISPHVINEVKNEVEKIENRFLLACPVWGPPAKAQKAELVVIASGKQSIIDKIMHLLVPVLGKKAIPIGEDVTKAAKYKLVGNFFVGGIIEMLSEGLTFADKNDISRDKMMEFFEEFSSDAVIKGYGKRMVNDTFTTDISFSVNNAMKDVRLMRNLADDSQAQLPIADLLFQHLLTSKANGGQHYDCSSAVGALRLGKTK